MNKKIEELKEILKEEKSRLKVEVIKSIFVHSDNDEDLKNYLSDVIRYGCQSGIASDMIYYKDTITFYDKHKYEINKMLSNTLENIGSKCLVDIFGVDRWDEDDPLILEINNQNLLAWFAYENTCLELYTELFQGD